MLKEDYSFRKRTAYCYGPSGVTFEERVVIELELRNVCGRKQITSLDCHLADEKHGSITCRGTKEECKYRIGSTL